MSRSIIIAVDNHGDLNSAYLCINNKLISLEPYLIKVYRILNSFEDAEFKRTAFNEFTITDRKVINALISKIPNLEKSKRFSLKNVIISASLMAILINGISTHIESKDSDSVENDKSIEFYIDSNLYSSKNPITSENRSLVQDISENIVTQEDNDLTEKVPVIDKQNDEDLSLAQSTESINADDVIIDEEYLYEDDMPVYSFDYEDRSNTEKSNYAKNTYGSIVNKYAATYGLDSKLVMAILTQENAYNKINNSNIGANGVMQIESIWNGHEIKAFNYLEGIVDKEIIEITKLSNPEYSIKIGCMILSNQYATLYNNYYVNGIITKDEVIIATVISYNKGISAICNLINSYGDDFVNHISETIGGDNNYLKHVFSYLEDMSIIQFQNKNDSPSEVVIDNLTL